MTTVNIKSKVVEAMVKAGIKTEQWSEFVNQSAYDKAKGVEGKKEN